MEWTYLKSLLSLGGIISLMLFVAWAVRKATAGTGAFPANRVDIRVLGSRSMAPKRSIVTIEVLGRVLVVGMSEAGMHTLSEIPSAEVADLLQETDRRATDRTPLLFSRVLGKHLGSIISFTGSSRRKDA